MGGIRTHGNLAVLAFLSAMKWPVISELRHIIGLVVPASGGGVSGCGHTTWCVWHLDTESGTVFPSNLFCSSGMAWTLRTCRTGWGDKETHTGREREGRGRGGGVGLTRWIHIPVEFLTSSSGGLVPFSSCSERERERYMELEREREADLSCGVLVSQSFDE